MRILVTGGSGRLGSALLDRLVHDGRHEVVAWSGTTVGVRNGVAIRPVELTDGRRVADALDEADPDAVIHAGALSSAEAVHRDPARGRDVNVEATRRLADWAGSRGRRLVFTSTDLVFDGSRSWYREDDEARPVLGYGRTKLEAEAHVVAAPAGLVARLSLLYGPNPSGRPGFFDLAIEALRRGESRPFFRDEFRTPLDYRTAAAALMQLAESGAVGIVHVGGRERLSRYELMRRAAAVLGIEPGLVRHGSQSETTLPEPRPADASLDTSRLDMLCPALERPAVEAALGTPAP
jgi:dTDP-4-dehydrorhamnose reductase